MRVSRRASSLQVTTVVATRGGPDALTEEISYSDTKIIGNGSFGIVFQVSDTTQTHSLAHTHTHAQPDSEAAAAAAFFL